MTEDIRSLIDQAKLEAETKDAHEALIQTPDGWIPVRRSKPRAVKPEDVDPSNVKVAPDRDLVAMLVAQLHDIRAQKRELDDRDSAIKDILQEMAGEVEYMSLAEGERPVFSLKHEQSVRINTAKIKDLMPAEDNPELYTTVNSRPLRLI